MAKVVALPRAMLYYQFFPLWKTFFEYLGAEVITTSETKRLTLAQGSSRVVAETCLPAKVYCGHVIDLAGKADFIFIPCLRSVEPSVYNCSKFVGLPDLVRGVVKESPPILDIEIDVNKGHKKVREEIHWLGKHFTNNRSQIDRAWELAQNVDRDYNLLMRRERLTPPEAIARLYGGEDDNEQKGSSVVAATDRAEVGDADHSALTVAVIGHPYNIYDAHINHNLLKRLKKLGIRIVTSEVAPESALDLGTEKLVKKPYWTFEDEVVGAAGHYLDSPAVDGIVCVVCFGCGPDSMMVDVIQRAAKKRIDKPLMVVTIDEHTGEAGLVTRLEAFVDMLYRRHRAGAKLA